MYGGVSKYCMVVRRYVYIYIYRRRRANGRDTLRDRCNDCAFSRRCRCRRSRMPSLKTFSSIIIIMYAYVILNDPSTFFSLAPGSSTCILCMYQYNAIIKVLHTDKEKKSTIYFENQYLYTIIVYSMFILYK